MNPIQFYAVESNPRTRTMYGRYGIEAAPYDKFIRSADSYHEIKQKEPEPEQLSLFG